jgi:hypothetical protein
MRTTGPAPIQDEIEGTLKASFPDAEVEVQMVPVGPEFDCDDNFRFVPDIL